MRETLERCFGPGGAIVARRAPGRVNLIGEHTDYNDGFVLPMALEFAIRMAGRRREAPEVRVHSRDFGESVTIPLDRPIAADPAHPWSNYVRGVLWALAGEGVPLEGMDLAFGGDVPQGAGLSSSAALEVVTAMTARALLGFEIRGPALARLCQRAENDFVGMKCGIMDQFISLMGKADHALFLDCRSLEHQLIPLELGDHVVAIVDSGVKHALVGSEYNIRRQECVEGLAAIRRRFPAVSALRDATSEQLGACAAELRPAVARRCRHVVSECQRVLDSVAALRRGDLVRFGALMNASHESLRDDYEVSCREVDLLVGLARKVPGVLGARITGGGFGGCTVNLVARSAIQRLRSEVLDGYKREVGITPRFFITRAADGADV
ncbi:MAG TPA: galactokinase [Anaeromyxobacter sp.]|nr:galactokinase [Anaeromyxobacter sp.]HVO19106.1 galactokinase [Anaeromyxobacter sp.]